MALIKCPECGRLISDKATTCPHCGVPLTGIAGKDEAPIPSASDTGTNGAANGGTGEAKADTPASGENTPSSKPPLPPTFVGCLGCLGTLLAIILAGFAMSRWLKPINTESYSAEEVRSAADPACIPYISERLGPDSRLGSQLGYVFTSEPDSASEYMVRIHADISDGSGKHTRPGSAASSRTREEIPQTPETGS